MQKGRIDGCKWTKRCLLVLNELDVLVTDRISTQRGGQSVSLGTATSRTNGSRTELSVLSLRLLGHRDVLLRVKTGGRLTLVARTCNVLASFCLAFPNLCGTHDFTRSGLPQTCEEGATGQPIKVRPCPYAHFRRPTRAGRAHRHWLARPPAFAF